MSHDATNWAIKQRGIKPALKVVLWHLCDRYNPDMGCFPSQDTLAADCEVPRSTLNVYLNELEEAGLIAREQRREPGSNRQERTRYRFPFEPDFSARMAENPSPESGHGTVEAVSRNGAEPSPENGESRVQNLDSNPVREPVKVTSKEREGAREARGGGARSDGDEHAESPASIERAFKRWFFSWPTAMDDSEPEARKIWQSLSSHERQEVERLTPTYLAARLKLGRTKKGTCAAGKYLRERRWTRLRVQPAEPQGPKLSAPWGKLWMSEALADLLRKPYGQVAGLTAFERTMVETGRATAEGLMREKIRKAGWTLANTMMERARERKGYPCRAELLPLAEGFHQAQRTGELFAAWKREFHRRGWPFPGETPEWVYFPPVAEGWEGDPDGAVRTAIDDFAERLREVRGDDDAA